MLAKSQLTSPIRFEKHIRTVSLKKSNNDAVVFHRTLYEDRHIFIQKQNICHINVT